MVQVFGNRIIGGVGAPDPRMSEAFGAGVNTALSQRESRQAMVGEAQRQRMLEQEFSWKGEDREEAKRRRAAAAAEAAAARARGIAAIEAMRSGGAGGPYFQLGAKSTAGGATAPAPRAGVDTSFPLGVAAPTVAGGAGSTSVGGGTGTDRLGVTGPTFEVGGRGGQRPMGVGPSVAGELSSARPGDFAARATQGRIDQRAQRQQDMLGDGTGSYMPMEGLVSGAESQLRAAERRYNASPTGENMQAVLGAQQQLRDITAAASQEQAAADRTFVPGGYSLRGVLAAEGPESVTIQGPNGPVTVPTATPAPNDTAAPAVATASAVTPVVPTAPGDLGFAGVPAMGQETTSQLGFGPRLGAAPTPTEQFLSAVGAAPPGEIDIEALRSSYDSPLYDPLFAQSAEQMRTALVYAAEDAAARGDVGGYVTAMAKVREQEMLILSQQLEVGLDEAKRFNSPQRLSAVLSMVYGGTDIFIAPTEGGLADVYVNGQLSETGTSIDELAANVRIMVDTGFREQMATAAAEQRAATLEVQKAVATEQGKLEAKRDDDLVRAELQAIGFLPPDEAVRFDEYSTGEVIGFDFAGNEVVRYAPVSQEDGTVVLREVRN